MCHYCNLRLLLLSLLPEVMLKRWTVFCYLLVITLYIVYGVTICQANSHTIHNVLLPFQQSTIPTFVFGRLFSRNTAFWQFSILRTFVNTALQVILSELTISPLSIPAICDSSMIKMSVDGSPEKHTAHQSIYKISFPNTEINSSVQVRSIQIYGYFQFYAFKYDKL